MTGPQLPDRTDCAIALAVTTAMASAATTNIHLFHVATGTSSCQASLS